MSGKFTKNETARALSAIFERHKNERVCVIGTMCCGKTTLIRQMCEYRCVDADDEFWPQIPEEETKLLSRKPITTEIIDTIFELMREKITVRPGVPLFGVALLDCEAVVYLDISEKLLEEHCEERGDTDFIDALFVKEYIEKDWNSHKEIDEKVFYVLTVTE